MCMCFFHNPVIVFITYIGIFNLDFFFTSNTVIVPMDLVPCVGWHFWNFTHVLM